MIRIVQEMWLAWRKPYSVALLALESGQQTPAMDFLRFKTHGDAAAWILHRELTAPAHTELTRWVVVDLRRAEQLELY